MKVMAALAHTRSHHRSAMAFQQYSHSMKNASVSRALRTKLNYLKIDALPAWKVDHQQRPGTFTCKHFRSS